MRCAPRCGRKPGWSGPKRRPTRSCRWPTSPRWRRIAHGHGALLACDNTFATPVLQRPLALGADVVMHSTTKYLGGHSDVMGGALVFAARDALHDAVAHRRHITGAILAPFSAWLTLRGCRSLPARMAWHCANARAHRRLPGRASGGGGGALPRPGHAPGHATWPRRR